MSEKKTYTDRFDDLIKDVEQLKAVVGDLMSIISTLTVDNIRLKQALDMTIVTVDANASAISLQAVTLDILLKEGEKVNPLIGSDNVYKLVEGQQVEALQKDIDANINGGNWLESEMVDDDSIVVYKVEGEAALAVKPAQLLDKSVIGKKKGESAQVASLLNQGGQNNMVEMSIVGVYKRALVDNNQPNKVESDEAAKG